jgi:hypothetical protein
MKDYGVLCRHRSRACFLRRKQYPLGSDDRAHCLAVIPENFNAFVEGTSEEEMAELEKNSPRELSSQGKFNAFLKEYKELIATVSFFAVGILGVLNYFATKEELKTIDCLLQNHVQFLRGMRDQKTYGDEWTETTRMRMERLKKPQKGGQSSEQLNEIAQLEGRIADLKNKRDDAEKHALDAQYALDSRACEKHEKHEKQ